MSTTSHRSSSRSRSGAWRLRQDVVLGLFALGLALAITGCATRIRNVPTHALTVQPSTVVQRDRRQCEDAITGRLRGAWFPAELEYAACMISRNYRAYVQVIDAPVEVQKASLRRNLTQARILDDLLTCEILVDDDISTVERIGRPMLSVISVFFWPATVGSFAASATLHVPKQRVYTTCMEPRGYVVTMWKPDPNDQTTRAADGWAP